MPLHFEWMRTAVSSFAIEFLDNGGKNIPKEKITVIMEKYLKK
jgi:hypothetical protein